MDFCIGSDILDIGSRRVEIKCRQQRQLREGGETIHDWMSTSGPTHFDVPNVSNVRELLIANQLP